MKKLVLAVCFLFAFVSASNASDSYLSVKAGGFFPNTVTAGLNDYKTGYNVEIASGTRFHPNLAVEIGIGYYGSEKAPFNIHVVDESVTLYVVTPSVSVIPITATLKGIIPAGAVDLFAGGGGSYNFATLKSWLAPSVSGGFDDTRKATGFGYHIVGGADVHISNTFAVGVEIKRTFIKPEFNFSEFKEKVSVGGTFANACLKYKFK